jgi:hypothetical protein
MSKILYIAASSLISASQLFSTADLTADDLRATRRLMCEECRVHDESRRFNLNGEDQFVFSLVQGLRERYPYHGEINFYTSKVDHHKNEIDLCRSTIELLQKEKKSYEHDQFKYQSEIDLLLHQIARNEKKIMRSEEKIIAYQKANELNKDNQHYMFFSSLEKYVKDENDHNPEQYRLDIEGEMIHTLKQEDKTIQKKYVRLQLQNHTGQNNSYASILAQTDFPIHVNHLFFVINCAVYKYTKETLPNKQHKNQIKENFFGVVAEKMKSFPKDDAIAKPLNVYSDDPVFMCYKKSFKKHLENKHEKTCKKMDEKVSQQKDKIEQAPQRWQNKKKRK